MPMRLRDSLYPPHSGMSELEPHEALLRQHTMRVQQLLHIYAHKARVNQVFDRLARVHDVIYAAAEHPDASLGSSKTG